MWFSHTFELGIHKKQEDHFFMQSRFLVWNDRVDFFPSQDRIELVTHGLLRSQRTSGRFDEAVVRIEGAFMGTTYMYTSATSGALACLCLNDLRVDCAKQFGAETIMVYLERLFSIIGRPIPILRCC